VVPVGESELERWIRPGAEVVRFGPGGDVELAAFEAPRVVVRAGEDEVALEVPFTARHQLQNLLAAVAAARAAGVRPGGPVAVEFGRWRGERITLPSGAVVIDDCYNANPLSMRAALDDLSAQDPAGRRIAVLGDMLELGAEEAGAHRAVGEEAAHANVDVLVAVGPRAAAMADAFGGEVHVVPDAAAAARLAGGLVGAGDLVLVKGSRGVGLEVVAEQLRDG
jgi:UDP-N-acetylmuramoyl-tripeptide--D-alanyl-D-alanine ligase